MRYPRMMKVAAVLFLVLLVLDAHTASGAELQRRTWLGLRFDLSDRSDPGLLVSGVAVGSTAHAAGMRVGDRLTSVGGLEVLSSLSALRDELAETAAGARIELRWYRGPNTVFRAAPPLGVLPPETVPGSSVRYDAVAVDGLAQRLILSEPEQAAGLIFYLQDMGCDSLDFWQATGDPVKKLIDGWAGAGYATARIEKRGVGDSQGPPCRELDLVDERRGFLAALERLAALGWGGRTSLFGHGLGGVHAPHVATDAVAAVMVFGVPPLQMLTADPPESRPFRFYEQLAAEDPERIWRQVWQPVLALHGDYDTVGRGADQQRIARLSGGRFQSLPALAHDLLRYESPEEAAQSPGTGTFDPVVVEATLTWLRTLTGQSVRDGASRTGV